MGRILLGRKLVNELTVATASGFISKRMRGEAITIQQKDQRVSSPPKSRSRLDPREATGLMARDEANNPLSS